MFPLTLVLFVVLNRSCFCFCKSRSFEVSNALADARSRVHTYSCTNERNPWRWSLTHKHTQSRCVRDTDRLSPASQPKNCQAANSWPVYSTVLTRIICVVLRSFVIIFICRIIYLTLMMLLCVTWTKQNKCYFKMTTPTSRSSLNLFLCKRTGWTWPQIVHENQSALSNHVSHTYGWQHFLIWTRPAPQFPSLKLWQISMNTINGSIGNLLHYNFTI